LADPTGFFLSSKIERTTMAKLKTIQERQSELQTLLATPAGQEELRKLETRWQTAGERPRASKESVITYILVHERTHGRIAG
jgi:hypothetical protein